MSNIPAQPLRRTGAFILFVAILAGAIFLAVGHRHGQAGGNVSPTGKWTCSMCPQFILPAPGKCPKCFMDLIPLEDGAGSGGRYEIILSHQAAKTAGIESVIADKNPPEQAVTNAAADANKNENGGETVYIPATAVLRNVGRAFVFVEADEGESLSFTLREIALGDMRGGTAEVRTGLHEGEAVVSAGAFRLDSALQIQGKISLVNLPRENLALVAPEEVRETYQPAERIKFDLRSRGIPLDAWFSNYESVRAALAKDDAAASERPAVALAQATELTEGGNIAKIQGEASGVAADFLALRRRLVGETARLATSRGLEEKRDAFEKVTADMVLLARKFGAPKSSLNLIFCPMAFGGTGAYWLQPQDRVDNPYHGLEMPECGWQVERLEP